MSNVASNAQMTAQSKGTSRTVVQMIESLHQASYSKHKHEEQGHRKVWSLLAETARFIYAVNNDRMMYADFIDEREKLGVRQAPKDGNKCLPFLRVAYGTWRDKDGNAVAPGTDAATWEPNRSCENYATALDYMIKQNVNPDDMVKFIEEFKSDAGLGALDGITATARKARGVTRTPTALTWKTGERENIRKAATLCDLPLKPADIKMHDGFAPALVCLENGKMVLKAVPLGTADDFIRYVRSVGLTEAAASEGSKGYKTGDGVSVDLKASREAAEAKA